jgi:hypothetical protein
MPRVPPTRVGQVVALAWAAGKGDVLAICQIEADTLTVCQAAGERPTRFASPAGTRAVLGTFKPPSTTNRRPE